MVLEDIRNYFGGSLSLKLGKKTLNVLVMEVAEQAQIVEIAQSEEQQIK